MLNWLKIFSHITKNVLPPLGEHPPYFDDRWFRRQLRINEFKLDLFLNLVHQKWDINCPIWSNMAAYQKVTRQILICSVVTLNEIMCDESVLTAE